MGKKKPFIDRKNASTFHLMHRSQRDVSQHLLNEGDTHASAMILWPSPDNNTQTNQAVLGNDTVMQEWRQKLQQAGLLEEAQDAYLKEISGSGTFLNNNGRVASATDDWRIMETEAKDLDMLEVKGQMDNIPLVDALDEEMAAMVYDDSVQLDDFEDLNDEFIFDAAKEPEDNGNNSFDYDEHIRQLMEKAKKEREGGPASDKNNPFAQQDADFFARMKPLHERDNEDDDDSFADIASHEETAAFTAMTTPGVVPKLNPDEEKALCEKFAETLLEYDSDEIGDDPYEEIGGDRPLEGDSVLEAALDDFLEEKQDEILIHGNRRGRKGGSGYAVLVGKQMIPAKDLDPALDGTTDDPVENPPMKEVLAQAQSRLLEPHAKPPPEDVLIDGKSYFSEKVRNPWDCESILSTYSNLDNNPVTIGAGGRRRKRTSTKKVASEEPIQQIQLSNKTGLPLGVLNSRNEEKEDDEEESHFFDGSTTMSVNRGLARKKNESAEEKRARKAALKQERQMARIQKKVTREIFQEEFAKRSVALQADDVAGNAVFRYS